MLIYLSKDVDKQLILDFKSRSRQYHPVFPKNPQWLFLDTLLYEKLLAHVWINIGSPLLYHKTPPHKIMFII